VFKIEMPGDLKQAIKVIADNLADGTIVEYEENPMGQSTSVPFKELVAGEPWDDIVEYYFKCPKCNQCYCLSAETYHGGGGRWSKCTE
jgi:hypothetical protein